jgi:hypothetical protein
MTTKQLFALFLSSLIVWAPGSGLLPLLPVHATQIGAGPAVVGTYLSFSLPWRRVLGLLGFWRQLLPLAPGQFGDRPRALYGHT